MPPAKSRNHDDSKADQAGGKEKGNGHTSTKMRRVTSQQGTSGLREVQNASAVVAPPVAETAAPSIEWASFDRDSLVKYRRHYHLMTPSCFKSTFHSMVLSQPAGIGKFSPTMRARRTQRQTKEQLALACRKHFNGLGVQENDVIVDLIYKIRSENAEKSATPNKQSSVVVVE
ncbi:hypothetical protein N3K66_002168 [Trichothecium roseum]|uniref:Uncharacterized protein n=1 Tax=Trichothecium roseum TaxID=47278 RepID=A0ACC0V8K5_9HYPO|nr:hypothetical protein N3K66_002168 [Trichothecium roseum]